MDEAFAGYHPAVNFLFFIAAIVFGMFFVHPAFLLASMLFSALYYFLLKGKKSMRFFLMLLPLFALISFLNPVFNPQGNTVLFTYLGGRPFTLEALLYGFSTGGMCFSVLLWFACYNAVMTSDKFIYLFGRFIPAVSLVLSMTLRLVPNFQAKAGTIAGARRCIGKSPDKGTNREKLNNGMDILSVLTSWALEGAIVTADSMKSRGYGAGRRTSFAVYRLEARDAVLLAVLLLLAAAVTAFAVCGGMSVTYLPNVEIPFTGYTAFGLLAYSVLLAIPSVIHIREEAVWHILRSRI